MTVLLGASRPGLEPERPQRALRLLFVKEQLAWPRSRGHDVHGYHMMRALARLGHRILLLTAQQPTAEAVQGLPLEQRLTFAEEKTTASPQSPQLTRWQQRHLSYWGTDEGRLEIVARVAADHAADAVVVVGTETLPYLARVQKAQRVWYAADDPVWTQLSGLRLLQPRSWSCLKRALASALYVRAFAATTDSAWVVSDTDRRWLRWFSGSAQGRGGPERRRRRILSAERGRSRGAGQTAFSGAGSISGPTWMRWSGSANASGRRCGGSARRRSSPSSASSRATEPGALPRLAGVSLLPDLADLRTEVCRRQVVVLPFVSGGGIKNKLLEAAALGRPIVCTPRACNGLRQPLPPLLRSADPARWSQEILSLWASPDRRAELGEAAGSWVRQYHDWSTTAREAIATLKRGMGDA